MVEKTVGNDVDDGLEMKLTVPKTTFSWSQDETSDKRKRNRRSKTKDAIKEESVDDPDAIAKTSDNDDSDDDIFDDDVKHKPSTAPPTSARRMSSRRDSRPSMTRQSSRYVERRRGEDEAAQAGFERHLERREGARRTAEKLLDGVGDGGQRKMKVGAEEAFDFFCAEAGVKKGENQERREEGGHDEGGEDEVEEDPEVEGSDKKKLLSSDILGGFGYEWTMTEPAETWVESKDRLRSAEERMYFRPSSAKVDVGRKLNADERPRFAEEEGVYVGERPKVPAKVKNRLENRILYEYEKGARTNERKQWFGRDGRLVSLPDPTLRAPTRPSPLAGDDDDFASPASDATTALRTVFCRPNLPGADGAAVAGTDQPGVAKISSGFAEVSKDDDVGRRDLTHCQLEVDVASVAFDHHHLFSLEHHLAARLTQAFDTYQQALSRSQTLGLERRLKLLYNAADELKEKLEIEYQKAERDFQTRRLESYRREICLVRKQRDEESAKERAALREIVALWKNIKELRRQQGYSNTQVKLIITKESVDPRLDKREWEAELHRELEEAREEYERGLEEANAKYERDLDKWKEMHNARKAARRRKKKRDQDSAAGSGTADVAAMEADEKLLAAPEEDKPEPPEPFDQEMARKRIEKHARECRRPPGETKLFLELQQRGGGGGAQETNDEEESAGKVDAREKSRRAAAAKAKVFIKLYFNGREVCHSRPLPLSSSATESSSGDFVLNFASIYPLQIMQWPESLKLQVLEGGHLRPTLLAEVSLPLPATDVTLESLAAAETSSSSPSSSSRPKPIYFTSGQRVRHSDNAAVGSGVDFSATPDGTQIRCESTRGRIFARVGWGKTSDGVVLSPPPSQWAPPQPRDAGIFGSDVLSSLTNSSGALDPAKLEEWMRRNNVDPNDPANVELMERVSSANSSNNKTNMKLANDADADGEFVVSTSGRHFRLDSHHDQLALCPKSAIDRNLRFRLLELRRSREVPEFRNYKMVPSSEKEIPKSIFEALGKKASESRRQLVGAGDPLRSRGRIYLEKLRQQVGHYFSVARRRKRHSDVVIEDPVPTLATFGALLGEIAPQQRPLKPVRTERKKVPLQEGQEVKILLSVVRAYDVPVRSDSDPLDQQQQQPSSLRTASVSSLQQQQQGEERMATPTTPRMATSDATRDVLPNEALVRSYVEARFQNDSARTSSAPGPNPAWNQQLTLNFSAGNNTLNAENLDTVRDNLHIHLFDEVSVDLVEDPEERSTQIHRRFERKWLGSLSVPFSALYRNTRIEGTFRLHSPAVLLGYERTGHLSGVLGPDHDATSDLTGGRHHHHGRDATYLNLYLTVEPPLSAPDPPEERLEAAEEGEAVVRRCERWARDMAGRFPHRKVNPLVADVNGRSVLLTRYFRGIKPPDQIMTMINAEGDAEEGAAATALAEKVAWFVSLIPYMAKNAMFPGMQEIWPNSGDFLNCLCGSESEHAVLLANYFSGMGKRAYLVLGQGVPEGDTAYVLSVEESGDQLLWNAVTGESFAVNSSSSSGAATAALCPLTSVHVVADETNVWGNVQPSSCPSRMRWELSNTSDWLPLFGGSVGNPNLPSVQPAALATTAPDKRAATSLKERLERVLRETLMHLRRRQRTTINFNGNAVLRRLLPGLERSRGGMMANAAHRAEERSIAAEHVAELSKLNASYKICGFPMHFAYHDADQLCEALRATGVHLNKEPKVEFALAVHAEPYPHTVMSVWVYVASMVRRDNSRRSTIGRAISRSGDVSTKTSTASRRRSRRREEQDSDSE